jgi:hypothetical protein
MTDTAYTILILPLVAALVLFFWSWGRDEWTHYQNRQGNQKRK